MITDSGQYTPNATPKDNVSSVVPTRHLFQRIGNVVTVHGGAVVAPSGTGVARVFLSLPYATDLRNALGFDCPGAGIADDSASNWIRGVRVLSDKSSDRAVIEFDASGANAHVLGYTFAYLVE
jgi:hypothetical protein